MKKTILYILLVSILITSCNTEKKNKEKEYEIQKEIQKSQVEKLIKKYSAKELTAGELTSYYSFELEEVLNEELIIGKGKILDIEKIENNQYLLEISMGEYPAHYFCALKADKKTIDVILEHRDKEISKHPNNGNNRIILEYYMNFTFICKPTHIKKGIFINKYMGDYTIVGETVEDAELDEYEIETEIDAGSYTLYGECIDLTLSNEN
ncbi:hypothetical protein [Lutibacter sp.]|uniref:hypothetical protein n=1 Tax=Lutibacter sp. TaxID=1925666 RepID=UPI001A2C5376|nr:hypothetical protein [Lutibacter sp.]MBI9040269.1 hypothetical protein [Lutibacter sp.]